MISFWVTCTRNSLIGTVNTVCLFVTKPEFLTSLILSVISNTELAFEKEAMMYLWCSLLYSLYKFFKVKSPPGFPGNLLSACTALGVHVGALSVCYCVLRTPSRCIFIYFLPALSLLHTSQRLDPSCLGHRILISSCARFALQKIHFQVRKSLLWRPK